jgi:L-threonylcarbamoyladenylate synthase
MRLAGEREIIVHHPQRTAALRLPLDADRILKAGERSRILAVPLSSSALQRQFPGGLPAKSLSSPSVLSAERMTRILDLLSSNDPRDVIHQAVQALAEGELAALPLEGSYVLSALATHPAAVARLEQAALPQTVGCLVLASAEAAADLLPLLSPSQERLLQRTWPGPVVFRFPGALSQGLGAELPAAAARQAAPDDHLQLLVTANEAVVEVLRLLPAPLLVRMPIDETAVVAQAASPRWDRIADVVLDAGTTGETGVPTIVSIAGERWRIDAQGLMDLDAVRDAGCETFLFVCTGNTCRSPMAAAVFRKLLAARLQCSEEDLPANGYRVVSAGLAALQGAPAAPEAIELVESRGGRLSRHQSQPLSSRLLAQADYVFTMTNSHRTTILQHHPELDTRVRTLADDGSDVADPIGMGMNEYQRCLDEISGHLQRILNRLGL